MATSNAHQTSPSEPQSPPLQKAFKPKYDQLPAQPNGYRSYFSPSSTNQGLNTPIPLYNVIFPLINDVLFFDGCVSTLVVSSTFVTLTVIALPLLHNDDETECRSQFKKCVSSHATTTIFWTQTTFETLSMTILVQKECTVCSFFG